TETSLTAGITEEEEEEEEEQEQEEEQEEEEEEEEGGGWGGGGGGGGGGEEGVPGAPKAALVQPKPRMLHQQQQQQQQQPQQQQQQQLQLQLQQQRIIGTGTTTTTTTTTTIPVATSSYNNMFPQQYCLRWKYHHSNLQTMFSQLLERQAYCDVTLACEGQTLRAHKTQNNNQKPPNRPKTVIRTSNRFKTTARLSNRPKTTIRLSNRPKTTTRLFNRPKTTTRNLNRPKTAITNPKFNIFLLLSSITRNEGVSDDSRVEVANGIGTARSIFKERDNEFPGCSLSLGGWVGLGWVGLGLVRKWVF
ncbi:hypothetical protein M0804_014712, partial [Polistes exclamans]